MTDNIDDVPNVIAPAVIQPVIQRAFAIDDLVVRSDGDGRTVEAYAAVFDEPTEIRDQYGHYHEIIDRSAFDGVLTRNVKPAVFFNHGRDIFGNPSDKWSAPVAVHRSASADGRGLRVSSWYVNTPAGDEALELIRSGAVDGFSFSGKPNRSQTTPPKGDAKLPTIRRMELSFAEYGPAVFRAYDGARVLAMRSEQIADQLGDLHPDQLAELVEVLRSRFPVLADDLGRSGGPLDADTVNGPTPADALTLHRRITAARLERFIP